MRAMLLNPACLNKGIAHQRFTAARDYAEGVNRYDTPVRGTKREPDGLFTQVEPQPRGPGGAPGFVEKTTRRREGDTCADGTLLMSELDEMLVTEVIERNNLACLNPKYYFDPDGTAGGPHAGVVAAEQYNAQGSSLMR